MVQFLNDLLSEDDEPPPLEGEDEQPVVFPYGVSTLLYPFVSLQYESLEESLLIKKSNEQEFDFNDFFYTLPLFEDRDETLGQSLDLLDDLIDNPQCTFDKAMVDYVFEQPSIENDELAYDRELLNDVQRAEIPFLRRLMIRRVEEEDKIFQRQLGYRFAIYD